MNVIGLFRLIDHAILRLNFAGLCIAALCLLTIVAIGTINAIALNVFGRSILAALEFSEILLAVLVFLGFATIQQRRRHIRFDIIDHIALPRLRTLSEITSLILGATLFSVLAWQAWVLAMSSWRIGETANAILAFPVYPAKFLVALGTSLAALECLRQLGWSIKRSRQDRGHDTNALN